MEPNHKVITLPDSKFIGKEGGTIDTLDFYDEGITGRVNDSWTQQKTTPSQFLQDIGIKTAPIPSKKLFNYINDFCALMKKKLDPRKIKVLYKSPKHAVIFFSQDIVGGRMVTRLIDELHIYDDDKDGIKGKVVFEYDEENFGEISRFNIPASKMTTPSDLFEYEKFEIATPDNTPSYY